MDCSICMEAITKATGSTVLSCEHAFHFRCIDSWFTKQINDDLEQTCPCCRNGGCDMDRCSVVEMDDEGDEDDEDATLEDAESQSAGDADDDFPDDISDLQWQRIGPGQWLIVSGQEVAYEGVRGLFGPLNELDAVEEDPRDAVEDTRNVAARKIQAIFRGTQTRNTHVAAVGLMRLFAQAYHLQI